MVTPAPRPQPRFNSALARGIGAVLLLIGLIFAGSAVWHQFSTARAVIPLPSAIADLPTATVAADAPAGLPASDPAPAPNQDLQATRIAQEYAATEITLRVTEMAIQNAATEQAMNVTRIATSGIIAIGLLGDYDSQHLNQNQHDALVNLMAWLCQEYDIAPAAIYPHRHFAEVDPNNRKPNTSPGSNIDINNLSNAVAARIATGR